MGSADRDDTQRPADHSAAESPPDFSPRAGGLPEVDAVTTWLVVGLIAVYIIDRVLALQGHEYLVTIVIETNLGTEVESQKLAPLSFWGHFSQYWAVQDFQFWRFVTYQFLHGNLNHLIFNGVALYFFGPMVEAYLTSRQFLVYYLLCGVGGAMLYMVLQWTGWFGSPYVPLVGASAGIFGVLIAATLIAPKSEALLFAIVPLPLRSVAWLFIGYALFTVIFRGSNAGGEAAHLGGAAAGWLLMRWPGVIERVAWFGRRAPPF